MIKIINADISHFYKELEHKKFFCLEREGGRLFFMKN